MKKHSISKLITIVNRKQATLDTTDKIQSVSKIKRLIRQRQIGSLYFANLSQQMSP